MNEVYTYRGITGIKLGDQFWMNKNLDIGEGVNNPEHPEFGKYYTWDQAMNSVPEGWRLPSKEDCEKLSNYINTFELKNHETWSKHGNGNNSIGFNALPTGYYFSGEFYDVGIITIWWSITELNHSNAYIMLINGGTGKIIISDDNKRYSNSVRCVQDWNIVKEWLNQNQEIELDNLDNIDDLNESLKFFKQSEKYL
jgi:uncharacterized protein (TIGR02145 family)